MPGYSKWAAEDAEGYYYFEVMARPEDDQAAAVTHLIEKVDKGIQHKSQSILSGDVYYSNAIARGVNNTLLNLWEPEGFLLMKKMYTW